MGWRERARIIFRRAQGGETVDLLPAKARASGGATGPTGLAPPCDRRRIDLGGKHDAAPRAGFGTDAVSLSLLRSWWSSNELERHEERWLNRSRLSSYSATMYVPCRPGDVGVSARSAAVSVHLTTKPLVE